MRLFAQTEQGHGIKMNFLLSFTEEKLANLLERILPHYFPDARVIQIKKPTGDEGDSALLLTDDPDTARSSMAVPFLLFGVPDKEKPVDISLPFRAGTLVDRLNNIINGPGTCLPEETIFIGPYRLDMHDGRLLPETQKEDGEVLYLTEKERAILYTLYEAQDKTVGRKELLNRVWEYADNVETHTLETHIYRLRQKIEEDPARPRLLITDNDGYFLKVNNR